MWWYIDTETHLANPSKTRKAPPGPDSRREFFMSISDSDKALGMDRPISRRDFLNGVALTTGALALGAMPSLALGATPPGDPAKLTGLRGHSETAMNIMHAVRDGTFWNSAPALEATGESYDLVVVGGGISGLAAALLYRQQKPDARVLILENNDEFGGHARRNEFTSSGGKRLIGYGGSQSLQTPSLFSPLVQKVLTDIGIETQRFEEFYDQDWWDRHELADAHFFRKEDFGTDALVAEGESAADWVPQTPLNDTAKANLIELIDSPPDYLAGKSLEEKMKILSETTYDDFLTVICGYDPQLVTYFKNATEEYLGMGIEGTTALDAWGIGVPGFDGMELGDKPYKTMSPSGRLEAIDEDPYIYHFPDGNAGVARALVRALIPAALAGSSMEELVNNSVDYAALDVADSPVRLRLGASVVRVKHDGDPASAKSVTLTYLEEGRLKTVSGAQVVLACWHRVIPYLTDELAPAQVDALNDQIKVPLIYGTVQLKDWKAFDALKIDGFNAPNSFWRGVYIDDPVSIGDIQVPRRSGRADAAPHLQFPPARHQGHVGARPGDRRTAGAHRDHFRRHGTRPARPHEPRPQGRRLRCGARHRGADHQPLEPRLRARIYAALGRLLARWSAAGRSGPQRLGPHRHRQFRFGRLRLCPLRHRPGGARRRRIARRRQDRGLCHLPRPGPGPGRSGGLATFRRLPLPVQIGLESSTGE